jgi:hypothetical protein
MMYVGACEMAMHSWDAAQPPERTGHVRVGYLSSLQLFADQYTQRSSSVLTYLRRLATVLGMFSGRICPRALTFVRLNIIAATGSL